VGSDNQANSQIEAGRALAEGNRAWTEGDIERAAARFARAALLAPNMALAHANLGVTLRRLGKIEAAIASYGRALALNPDDGSLHSNLGNALREAGRLAAAESHLRRATEAQPASAQFRYNLALALRDRRHHQEARALLAGLVAGAPDNGDYAWDLALSDLYLQDYAAGFAGYEARWRLARSPARDLPGTRWLPGMTVAGKTLFIAAEQGFGDSLQFARFLPLVARQGARVVVECLPELVDLFAALPGIAQVLPRHAPPPPYDLWAPIMSLAWLLGVSADALPAEVPYLAPPPKPAPALAKPPGTKLNVGLIWAGKTTPRDRSWPLEKLLPLTEDPRIAWWSLQMGPRAADLAVTGASALIRDLGPGIANFADTAALMARLDLIVTIDTSAAHLAGALARPTFVLLRHVSDWRWLDEPETCAWYPTMRLFRQPEPADFTTPVARLKAALDQLVTAHQAQPDFTVGPRVN
jgi:tetratricopeptide (TPR) repeat protein